MGRLLALVCALAVLSPPLRAEQRSSQSATVQEILDGPELYIDRAQASLRQQAHAPQTISTGHSRGQLAFGSGATGRINRHSLMQLGARCFVLNRGEVLVSGPQPACTRSTRLSVRGTNILLGLNAAEETELAVLEGEVELELLRNGQVVSDPITRVTAGQRLQLSPAGEVLTLSQLSRDDYATILRGPLFQDFQTPLAEQALLDRRLRQVDPSLLSPSRPDAAPSAADQMRAMLEQVRRLNASLDARSAGWQRDHERAPGPDTCWSEVQGYYQSIARTYRDWQAPRPPSKGRFVTRIDFDVRPAAAGGSAQASNFLITRSSGLAPQDRSAFAEARRKSLELPSPPACVGDALRVYHLFIVEYF